MVSILGGGGVANFRAALRRKFAALIQRGSHCLILERTFAESHYVQAILTPVAVRTEAVGELYLREAGSELTDDQVDALERAGWLEPIHSDDWDEGEGPSANWWREFGGRGYLDRAVDQLLVTLVEVYGLEAGEPVHVEIFPALHQDWEWRPDPDHPCGGELEVLD